MSKIANGANLPLFSKAGDVPDVSGALTSYFQQMVFQKLTKTVSGFQLVETALNLNFRGVIMPLSAQKLQMKPEGQRQWIWQQLYADPSLFLNPDDGIAYNGIYYRVMAKTDYTLYGYVTYDLVQTYLGDV